VSLIAGGLLVLLLLLSILGGLDFDLDVDSGDADAGGGGLGIIKGILSFMSVSAWMMRIALMSDQTMPVALLMSAVAGILALLFLNWVVRLLLKNESNVNWSIKDALFKEGEVYLKIPAEGGSGLVHIVINGTRRELKAKPIDPIEIKTGEKVVVMSVENEYVIVKPE